MRDNSPKDDVEAVRSDQWKEGQEPPQGRMGVDDIRTQATHQGHGRVADAAGVKSFDSEHHFAPSPHLNDDPTAEDPYGTQPAPGEFSQSQEKVREMQENDPTGQEYPSYEVGRCPDDKTGGSTDPHNSMTHANSGDETEGS